MYYVCTYIVALSGYEHTDPPKNEGPNLCPYCRLSPCIIIQAPSWLRGSAEASLSNQCKRYKLYRKFWSLLGRLGVWNDPVYLQYKQTKTSLNDPRDVMPNCVLTVSIILLQYHSCVKSQIHTSHTCAHMTCPTY